jgi:hypothetical protein
VQRLTAQALLVQQDESGNSFTATENLRGWLASLPDSAASTEQVTQQVTQQVKRLLLALTGQMSRVALMKAVKIKDRVSFSRNYLEPALASALIEMTQPNSPNSPTQQYRLTDMGKALLENNSRCTSH